MKVNIGSSTAGIEGWVNIDNDYRIVLSRNVLARRAIAFLQGSGIISIPVDIIVTPPPNYMNMDVLGSPLPFKTASVDYCYTSHFLEHIPRYRACKLVREIHRILKPNGIFRVVVPDLYLAAKMYVAAKDGDKKAQMWWKDVWVEMDTPAEKFNAFWWKFPRNDLKYTGFSSGITQFMKSIFLPDMGHQWIYDFEDLKALLVSQGFHDVKRYSYRRGRMPDVEKLDNRPYESMYVEAQA